MRTLKTFNLGRCAFSTSESIDPLDYIKNNNFFDLEEMENLHYMFSRLPLVRFQDLDKKRYKEGPLQDNIYFMSCVNDEYNWNGHQVASYLNIKDSHWGYMLGFAQQKISSSEISTFLHSFNSVGNQFVDTYVQAKAKIHKSIEEKEFSNYIGISLPVEFVREIFTGTDRITGNVWGYLLKQVLPSRQKTEKLCEDIESKTKILVAQEYFLK